jgi:hypothetical protein
MSNPELTKNLLEKFKTALKEMPDIAPEGQNQVLWNAQREGAKSKISDLERQLYGETKEDLAFEAFWKSLEMPEKNSNSQEDEWIVHRSKIIAWFAWIKAIEYQANQNTVDLEIKPSKSND